MLRTLGFARVRRTVGAIGSRLTYANVMSTLALLAATTTGTAWAAAKIGSADIKSGAVKERHIAKGQVRFKHLTVGTRTKLRGPRGPRGLRGARGARGIQGPQGAQGVQGAAGLPIESLDELDGIQCGYGGRDDGSVAVSIDDADGAISLACELPVLVPPSGGSISHAAGFHDVGQEALDLNFVIGTADGGVESAQLLVGLSLFESEGDRCAGLALPVALGMTALQNVDPLTEPSPYQVDMADLDIPEPPGGFPAPPYCLTFALRVTGENGAVTTYQSNTAVVYGQADDGLGDLGYGDGGGGDGDGGDGD